ncbi:MAG: hypothetical protein ACJAVX_000801 [Pseudoalteromonas rhizosphaerae]|jgi:hypothetical protein
MITSTEPYLRPIRTSIGLLYILFVINDDQQFEGGGSSGFIPRQEVKPSFYMLENLSRAV